MRQPISPTKKPLFSIESESSLRLLDRSLDRQRRGTVGSVILQRGFQFLDLLLLPLGKLFGILAGGETSDVGDSGERGREEDGGEG